MKLNKKTKALLINILVLSIVMVTAISVGYSVLNVMKVSFDECVAHPNQNITTSIGNLSCDADGYPIMKLSE